MAMLVCGENPQIEGINYQPTYASTGHLGQVWLTLLVTAKYNLKICQMDVSTAFLRVNLGEEITMPLPQGYFGLLQNG
jgi:hypothetical protein